MKEKEGGSENIKEKEEELRIVEEEFEREKKKIGITFSDEKIIFKK